MKEFLFDANKLGFSPNYILFSITIDDKPYIGKFMTTYLNLDDPFGTPKQFKFESYGTINKYKSGSPPDIIDRVDPSKIKIMDIIDGSSNTTPTTLSGIIEIADQISKVDTSFDRYVVKERIRNLFNDLSEKVEEYGVEHPKSDYKTLSAFIEQQQFTISNLDSHYLDNEADNRDIMRKNVDGIKEELKKWMRSLIFRGDIS